MKQKSAISPEVEKILSQCADNAERIRIARRLEAIAAEIWERVFEEKTPSQAKPPFRRN
jgi:hypothetical protein